MAKTPGESEYSYWGQNSRLLDQRGIVGYVRSPWPEYCSPEMECSILIPYRLTSYGAERQLGQLPASMGDPT